MIPVCVPLLKGKELEYLKDCIDTNWISSRGRYVEEFEKKFSEYCNCGYGITTTNGTSSVHLALESVGLKKRRRSYSACAPPNSCVVWRFESINVLAQRSHEAFKLSVGKAYAWTTARSLTNDSG
jgi:DegT/DnrJ/EryC1/StrS aminotransferase family